MPYYLSPQNLDLGTTFSLKDSEFKHIKVNRQLKIGKLLILQDPTYKRFACEVIGITKTNIHLRAIKIILPPQIETSHSHLYISLIKEKGLDYALQKSTELNIGQIVLFKSSFSQNLTNIDNKIPRWEKIIQEATKQSNRIKPPKLIFKNNLMQAVNIAEEKDQNIVVFDQTGNNFKLEHTRSGKINALFVGPEGGFTKKELENLPGSKINLGSLVLRTETACAKAITLFSLTNI